MIRGASPLGRLPLASDPAISGTLSVTDGDDTLSAAGQVKVQGSASITDSDDTLAAAGAVQVQGTASITDADDTASSAGGVKVQGSGSITDSDDTVAAAGQVKVQGVLNVTDSDDTLSASGGGAASVTGNLNVTDADDTISAAGAVKVQGAAAVADQGDTLAATGAGPSTALGREVVLAAFNAALQSTAGVVPARNLDDPVAAFPAVRVFDGAMSLDDSYFGEDRYTLEIRVEAYASAATDEALSAALSQLHAAIVVAAMADVTLGGVAEFLRQAPQACESPQWISDPGKRPAAMLAIAFECEFVTATGDPLTAPLFH